jgi:hypothetical protein
MDLHIRFWCPARVAARRFRQETGGARGNARLEPHVGLRSVYSSSGEQVERELATVRGLSDTSPKSGQLVCRGLLRLVRLESLGIQRGAQINSQT